MPEKRIIITATSAVVEEITRREILLDSAFDAIVPPGGYLSPELVPGVWISFLPNADWTVLVSLPEIHFATQFGHSLAKVEKDAPLQFRPTFLGSWQAACAGPLAPIGEYHGFRLRPLPNMKFWFAHHRAGVADFLIAQDLRTGHLYHPPCPNVHGDGRVCSAGGNTASLPAYASGPLLPWILARLETWGSRTWNADLMSSGILDPAEYAKILSFDERTGVNIPYPREWTSVLEKIAPPTTISGPISAVTAKK